MKKLWVLLAASSLFLVGCSPDKTLETLVPGNSLAVVLVDHPGLVAQVAGPRANELPWKGLDQDKPWAAAVVPANPPGFLLVLALADQGSAWTTVQTWARDRGGLEAVRFGTYAVLTSPGVPAPSLLAREKQFNLDRVRFGGDLVSVYIDLKNVEGMSVPPAMAALSGLGWAGNNLSGLRVGFSPRDGGLEVRVVTDWKPSAAPSLVFKKAGSPADLSLWTGILPPSQGLGVAASLPASVLASLGQLWGDLALERRWASLAPLVGPRLSVAAQPRSDGTWSWEAAIEAPDPQAVRQALKTLVAGGELQRHFPRWAVDVDTPLIYQDKPDGWGGVRTQITLGSDVVHLGYGTDRVTLAGGPGALEAVRVWQTAAVAPAPWFREAPDASVVAVGSIDGLGAKAALKILTDGNLELRVWADGAQLKAWEERLPQAARTWLSGPVGWTRAEP